MSRHKRKQRADLEWPPWMVDLAARDVPPAELDASLLARLKAAGVSEILPADATVPDLLKPDEHERGDAIAATGPGFTFIESIEDGPMAVADALGRLCVTLERYDKLRVFRLAAIDMEFAAATARALADADGPVRIHARVLETGLVVTYARPYISSNRRLLGRRWWPTRPEDVALHERIIDELRHPYHAHPDRTALRTLVDTTAMLGIDGPSTFAEGWQRLSGSELEQLAGLAERQAARLAAEADELGAELGEERSEPSYPRNRSRVDYQFDDGIEAASARLREAIRAREDG